ncbi:restriction endonuclease subunit S [Pseudomonas sp. GD03721]|nr:MULTISPECIES: restriction endonuclease subunit S [unclassified Pseudomonas]MDH1443851.1 restriction endonuclease subunit S [Pseudomonas sp. GD03722]WGG00676.1 restriction endonuclease subunit S [Pseudomonas sp. GD03721]WGG04842.1 restriction endonuclease subunit S [Pseudomonas sp. GD03919]
MSFPTYPAYKDSGVEWLGEVPEHWAIFSLKRSVDGCTNGLWGDEPDGENDLAVIRVADFDRATCRVGLDKLTYRGITKKERASRLLQSGDLLIEKSGGGEKTLVGCVVLFEHDFEAITSNFVARMRPLHGFDSGFLCYSFDSLYQGKVNFPAIKQTTGIQNLDSESYLQERFCFPTLAEQTQIARFLDHETARIDALIEEQQRLIELLKEKRQAVISHAVTKGLDPTVPMKDSGVEWLGEVPAHWQVCKLSFRYSVELGKMLDEKRNTGANPVPYLRNQDVQWGAVNIDELPLMDIEPAEYGRYTVSLGDLLVCEGGDVGRAAIWRHIDSIIGYQKALHRLRPESPKSDTAEFFFYTLMAAKSLGVFEESDTKATISHLPAEKFRQYRFAFPPLEEQQKIAAVMGEILERSNETISYAERTITLLQERRSALISAAVTGKIDVRDWQPPASSQAPEIAVAEAN